MLRAVDRSQLSSPLLLGLLVLAAVWIAYAISGLRAPWTPIVVSDSNSGGALRKALFGAAGVIAVACLLERGIVGRVLAAQRRLVGLGLLVLGSTLYSTNPGLTLKRGFVLVFAILAVTTLVHTARDPVRRMQLALVGGTAGAAWISLAAKVALPAACSSIAERPGLAGVTSHPNTCGVVMATGLIVSWGVATRSARERLLLRGAQLGLALALVLAGSVTSLAYAALGTLVCALLSWPSYRRGILLLVSGLGCLSVVTLFLVLGVDGALGLVGRDASLSGRDSLWGALLSAGLERPLFGSGFGAFWREGRGRELVATWNPRQAHNAYLDLFVDLGAIGALCVLGLVARILLEGWQRWGRGAERRWAASVVATSLALFLVYGFGESFLLKPDKLVFFALLWFLALLERRPLTQSLSPSTSRGSA